MKVFTKVTNCNLFCKCKKKVSPHIVALVLSVIGVQVVQPLSSVQTQVSVLVSLVEMSPELLSLSHAWSVPRLLLG